MPKPAAKSMTPAIVAAVTLATIISGAASANDACVSGRPGADRQHCYVAPDREGLLAVMPVARLAPSPIVLRVRNVTQRSGGNANAELLLAQGLSRDDGSSILSEAGAGEDGSQRIETEATKRSILMAALALAGIAGSVIFKLGSLRYPRRTRSRKRRGAIWAAADRPRRTAKFYGAIDERSRPPDVLRDLDQLAQRKAGKRKAMPRQARRSPI